jgi:hypothetical protein
MKVKQAPAVARGMAAASVNTLRPVHIPKLTKRAKSGTDHVFPFFIFRKWWSVPHFATIAGALLLRCK